MTELISKKTGTVFRKAKALKNENFKVFLEKTHKINTFFEPKKSTDVQSCEKDNFLNYFNNNPNGADQELSTTDTRNEIVNEQCQQDCVNNQNVLGLDSNGNVENAIDNLIDPLTDDPSKWNINDSTFVRNFLKSKVQQNVRELDFSKSKRSIRGINRSCTQTLFFKKKMNGEVHQRAWIFYSEGLGKMYCVYCLLFAAKRSGPFIVSGFDDWSHPSRMGEHETSKFHCEAAYVFTKRITEYNSVDAELAQQAIAQQKYWKEILKRILSTIRFLSSRGLPFRGKSEILGDCHNGNYLGTLELLAEWDPLLKSHLENYGNKGKGNVSYLSSTICNEFIHLLAAEVRTKILVAIKHSKYFSLIVDSTPDVSHIDQLTIVIRYVNEKGIVVERFLAFLENVGHKGINMVDAILDFLKSSGLIILDCRGQTYDNAKNMSGIYKGVQTRIIALNPLAVYVPCSAHSLNIVLDHAAGNTSEIVRFFMFIQNIYVFFAKSTKRWDILVNLLKIDVLKRKEKDPKVRMLVPKRLSDTRWSARDDACRALKAGYHVYAAALKQIFEDPDEKKVAQVEAESLYKEFFKLETAILLEFWSSILHQANGVIKSLQNPELDIRTSISLYKSLTAYVTGLRSEESFSNIEESCKTLIRNCSEWEHKNEELTYNCYNKRKKIRNTRYDCGNSADTIFDDSKNFRVKIFYVALDSMTTELKSMTESYEQVLQPFNFLFYLDVNSDVDNRDGASRLLKIYSTDLDNDFIEECIHFTFFMADIRREMDKDDEHYYVDSESDDGTEAVMSKKKKRISKPAKMLQYIKDHKIEATFPNLEVALRIFQCIAISNCTGERSFNALKRVKRYDRSTVKEEKLNDISILYIENDILDQIDADSVIDKFVESKERKRYI